MVPLLVLLLVSGCLGASLQNGATTAIHDGNDNEGGHESRAVPPETSPTINAFMSTMGPNDAANEKSKSEVNINDANMIHNPMLTSMGAIPPTGEAKQFTDMVDHPVDSSSTHNAMEETTQLTMKSKDLGALSTSIRTTPNSRAMTAEGYETSANSNRASDMKPMPVPGYGVSENSMSTVTNPMPTLGYGVSTDSSTAPNMKPIPSLGYGVSANSSIAPNMKPVPTLGYGVSTNSSMAASVKLTSSQGNGTSMTSSMTTQASKGTTSGNIATTTAPKKSGGTSMSVSILLSVVPVVISLVINH